MPKRKINQHGESIFRRALRLLGSSKAKQRGRFIKHEIRDLNEFVCYKAVGNLIPISGS